MSVNLEIPWRRTGERPSEAGWYAVRRELVDLSKVHEYRPMVYANPVVVNVGLREGKLVACLQAPPPEHEMPIDDPAFDDVQWCPYGDIRVVK
ncbi:MAG: hypothetical protein ACYTDU_17735 [Planctomycetota bacterium]|jgi:hypothetical protein